jgi:hypothetical protein
MGFNKKGEIEMGRETFPASHAGNGSEDDSK